MKDFFKKRKAGFIRFLPWIVAAITVLSAHLAVAMTFDREIEAQYIQPERPWNLLSYDVVKTSGDTGDFGL